MIYSRLVFTKELISVSHIAFVITEFIYKLFIVLIAFGFNPGSSLNFSLEFKLKRRMNKKLVTDKYNLNTLPDDQPERNIRLMLLIGFQL